MAMAIKVPGRADSEVPLPERLRDLRSVLERVGKESSIGLQDSAKELIREAHRRIGLRAAETGKAEALNLLKDLEIWRSLSRGTLYPLTGIRDITVILSLV